MRTDCSYKKKSSENKFWNFLIWNKLDQTMVRECDVRWNSIETSLTLFCRKMTELGFTFDGIDVVCPGEGDA